MLKDYAKRIGSLWLLFFTFNLFASEKADLLLVAYDQGESNAFIQLESVLKENGVSYRILAFGRAEEIFQHHPQRLLLSTDLPKDLKTNRILPLSAKILKELQNQYSFQIIYSGMASAAQAQVLNLYKDVSTKTIAFYDNFEPVEKKNYVLSFLKTLDHVDEFHVAGKVTADSFSVIAQEKHANVVVTGQPALEAWDKIYKTTEPEKIRSVLKLNPNDRVALFAGGYDSTYPQYLRTYILGCKQLSSYQCLITYHPKTDGSLERSEVKKLQASNVRVISGKGFSTTQLSIIASVIAVHKSTISVMAAYKGKPVLYIAEPEFSNFLITQGLAELASTPKDVAKSVQSLSQKKSSSPSLFPEQKASDFIVRLIKKKLLLIQQ
ncbi:hypothetical protein EOPP23_04170 [Endozoicomonas sp. OPT23]|uniref:hypothetical protein n=1 Tax=Endozoicomonas sp. OPT23 TaxID=2072845 RepID=UPI00129AAF20|nr:hypothetical protein [Endozoicomonas sp. OPT23]MRI32192.1 hypothetical protein [Endozoicomonas sp. OPT23]